MGLFYPYASPDGSSPLDHRSDACLVRYADAGYLSDPHKARSQMGFVFTIGNTAISWRSTKQTLVATSSNHAELIAFMKPHVSVFSCEPLLSIFGRLADCLLLVMPRQLPVKTMSHVSTRFKIGYIKGDNAKHIAQKFCFSHQQQEHQKIEVKQIRSQDNLADLFTKSPPKVTFQKLVRGIRLRRLSDLTRM